MSIFSMVINSFERYASYWTVFLASGIGLGLFALMVYYHLSPNSARYIDRKLAVKRLLTENEVEFLNRIESAVQGEVRVLCQVSMGALITTTLKANHPNFWKVRNSFSSKIIDFVICDKHSLMPLFLIELDDRTHDPVKDRKRDALVREAGLHTLRYHSRNKPSIQELRRDILLNLKSRPKF